MVYSNLKLGEDICHIFQMIKKDSHGPAFHLYSFPKTLGRLGLLSNSLLWIRKCHSFFFIFVLIKHYCRRHMMGFPRMFSFNSLVLWTGVKVHWYILSWKLKHTIDQLHQTCYADKDMNAKLQTTLILWNSHIIKLKVNGGHMSFFYKV